MNNSASLRWSEIKNWWPVIAALIGVSIWITSQLNDIRIKQALLEQKMDTVVSNTGGIQNQISDITQQHRTFDLSLGNLTLRVNNLEDLYKRLN